MTYPSHQWWDEVHGVMVVYMALPEGIDECVTVNPDLTYTVFVSTDVPEDRQKAAYRHALFHIEHNHLEDGIEASRSEFEAHRSAS